MMGRLDRGTPHLGIAYNDLFVYVEGYHFNIANLHIFLDSCLQNLFNLISLMLRENEQIKSGNHRAFIQRIQG